MNKLKVALKSAVIPVAFIAASIPAMAYVPPGNPYPGVAESMSYLAVRGTDDSVYYNQGTSAWINEGGKTIGVPLQKTVANNSTAGSSYSFFLTTGTGNVVYARDLSQGWRPLSSSFQSCLSSPAATVAAGVLYVGCESPSHSLRVSSAPVSPGFLPSTGAWTDWGGQMNASPTAYTDNATNLPRFIVRGTDNRLWETANAGSWVPMPISCAGHPEANANSNWEYATVICPGADKTAQYSVRQGGAWSNGASAGGGIREALQVRGLSASAVVYVADPSGFVWSATLTPSGLSGGWSQMTGQTALSR